MIVVSMLLVLVGLVTLLLGVFQVGDQPLQFVYASIVSCVIAAVLLVVGVVRNRPSRKPVAVTGGDVRRASWSGAGQGASQGAAETSGPAPPAAAETQPTERITDADSTTPIYPPDTPDDESWAPPRDDATAPLEEAGAAARTLAGVEGMTPAQRDAVQAEFGSMEALRAASVERLAGVRGVSVSLAKRIHDAVHA